MLEQLIQNSQIIIIEGERKSAKLTFSLFAIKNLLKKDAIILSPIEKHLFKRKIKIIQNRFESLKNTESNLSLYVLKEEWNTLKKRYSYEFFQEELKSIFQNTERQVVIMHRFGAFFEFQDRFEIEPMFRMIIDMANKYNKQVIFTISMTSVNYDFMSNIMCDFSDLTLKMQESNLNERSIHVMDSLQSIKDATFLFKDIGNNLSLEKSCDESENVTQNVYRVLLVSYENQKIEALESVKYLLSRRDLFKITYVSAVHEVVQQLFLEPDLLFFFIQREDFVYDVFKNLNLKLSESRFFVFFPQEFIRSDDRRSLHEVGIDDVFASNFQIDDVIVSIEKTVGKYFYNEALGNFSYTTPYLKTKDELHGVIQKAYDDILYFSLFLFHYDGENLNGFELGRESDFIFHDIQNNKIYYLALNTRKLIADKVEHTLHRNGYKVKLLHSCDVINIEKCLEM